MNLELFIAKRIHFTKEAKKKISPPAIRIATWGVALGLAVMLLSVAIVVGFKNEIREKVIGFSAHFQITSFNHNSSYETIPIAVTDSLVTTIKNIPGVTHIERFATKPGILKTDSDFQGIAMKGVDNDFNWDFFKKNMIAGDTLVIDPFRTTPSNDILVSKSIADKLHLKVGDKVFCYFVQNEIKARRLTITGIYKTNFTDYDKLFIIADARHIQKLNNWNNDQYSGIAVNIDNFDSLDSLTEELYFDIMGKKDKYGEGYYVRSIKEQNPQLFSWLGLLDLNVWVILILMSLVAGFTTISGLLIIILERTNMIGILKAMGTRNNSIRSVFLYVSYFLVGKGLLWGNIIGLSLCWLQDTFHIIKLDPEVYYLSSVPIELNWWYIISINAGCFFISMLMLLGPSYLVSIIRPAKSIKFD